VFLAGSDEVANDTRPPSNPGLGYVSKVSPDQLVERAMIQGIKYVDALPSTLEGGYSPMNVRSLQGWYCVGPVKDRLAVSEPRRASTESR
jgi:hypothetical protein